MVGAWHAEEGEGAPLMTSESGHRHIGPISDAEAVIQDILDARPVSMPALELALAEIRSAPRRSEPMRGLLDAVDGVLAAWDAYVTGDDDRDAVGRLEDIDDAIERMRRVVKGTNSVSA